MKSDRMYCTFCSNFYDSCSCISQLSPEPQESSDIKKAPSLTEKAKNFSKSLLNHAKSGFAIVQNKTHKKRLETCEKCEYYDEHTTSCQLCGCDLIIKTSWASESCPEGKWGPEKIKEQNIRMPQSSDGCRECDKKKT